MVTVDDDLLTRCSLTRHLDTWVHELTDDSDALLLLRGIAQGFRLITEDVTVVDAKCCIYGSALDPTTKPLFDDLFKAELAAGRFSLKG